MSMWKTALVLTAAVALAATIWPYAGAAEREATAATSTAPAGKIEAGKPTSVERSKDAWKDRGRIVGSARNAPAFTVTVLDESGKQVKAAEAGAPAKDGSRAYEVQWLDPGVYTMRVTAEGYGPLELTKLEVRANCDLQIKLEFTR